MVVVMIVKEAFIFDIFVAVVLLLRFLDDDVMDVKDDELIIVMSCCVCFISIDSISISLIVFQDDILVLYPTQLFYDATANTGRDGTPPFVFTF